MQKYAFFPDKPNFIISFNAFSFPFGFLLTSMNMTFGVYVYGFMTTNVMFGRGVNSMFA